MANQNSGFTGSEIMYPAAPTNGKAATSMAPVPLSDPLAVAGFGGALPRGPEILHGPFNATWFVNCLRRKWLPALLLGLLFATAAGGVLLWLFPPSAKVVAYLEVKAQQSETVFGKQRGSSPKNFEVFQQTQLALLKSPFVLKAALARKDISQLEAVVKQEPSAELWLSQALKISFIGRGEILEIRYSGDENPEEMKKIINAVIDSYKKEVLYTELARSSETRDSLSEMHKKIAAELEEKLGRYQKIAESLDGGDSPMAATMRQMLTDEVRLIQRQITQEKQNLVDLEVQKELAIQQARSITALDQAVQEELAKDPTIANYQQEQYAIDQQIRDLQSISKRHSSPRIKSLQKRAQQLAQQIQQYRISAEAELRNRLKSAPNDALAKTMTEYNLRRKTIEESLTQLQEDLEEKMKQLKLKGARSAELSMLQMDIDQLREVERTMEFQLRSWDVEDETAQDRVREWQRATAIPGINKYERFLIAIFGGLAVFCATCYGIALLEFRRRRLNGASDVDEGLGIRVLGVLPSVSSRKAITPGSPIAAQLSESIDSVRATLMHDSTSRPRQVVLVTSPATMEGCTTVASHLALSLTRAGRRTLLVDGDLREPTLHKLFGMPLEDGLSEVLRSEIDVSDAIHPTNTEGLWLLTAGQCDMDAIHALATEQPQPIFEKLRSEFDFVVIDGAPVLSMSDTLSIGQHVDGAILTVLRDHSEIRRIYQASEALKSMGIRIIGSVVNGVSVKADRRVARLHMAAAKQPRKLPASVDD